MKLAQIIFKIIVTLFGTVVLGSYFKRVTTRNAGG